MSRTCLQCGAEIRLGGLCAADAAAIATSDDFTAEQIIATPVALPSAWLVDQWGRTHAIPDRATVGRSPSEASFAVLHHTVSSMHAQFLYREDGWQLVDRGSLNGTFHSGLRIRESAVHRGDVVGFGDVSFYFAEAAPDDKRTIAGPGRTVRSKQDDLAFSAKLEGRDHELELAERPGGGIAQIAGGATLEFARLEFALLVILCQRSREARNLELAYVSSRELAETLAFRSHDADADNVRELIRRVRKKFQIQGITDLIESRQGAGYRIAWPFES